MNPTQTEITADEQRRENIHRILDHHDAHCREKGINPREVDRLEMRESMWEFANEAGISLEHFNQAYQHQISELNNTPSKFLTPIYNQKSNSMKKVEPLLPPGIGSTEQRRSPDEPTKPKVEPYISPLNFQK